MPNSQAPHQQALSLDHLPTPIEEDIPSADIAAGDAPSKGEEPAPDPAVEDLCDGLASTLALDSRTSELRFLHPGECRPSPLNGRDPARLSRASLEALINSIAIAGVVTPILVRGTEDAACPYEIIAGARRWAACTHLIAKIPDLRLPAIIVADDPRAGVVASDAENAARVGLSAYERGRAYAAALKIKAASSDAELAKLLGINARIKHLLDWIEDEERADLMCAAVDDDVVEAFREWSQAVPVVWRNKAGIVTSQKLRAPATTEESAHTLKSALRHAKDKKRVDSYPEFHTHQRKNVSQKIKARLPLEKIAQMLAYAGEPNKKRKALHAFLVASVSTLARPDAVFDISTQPSRQQWLQDSYVLSLNPSGRTQTKKRRPDVWVPPQLNEWLRATAADPTTNGWLVNYDGQPVADIGTAWDTMLEELGLPLRPEWKPYVIRRSMATILRNWHRSGGTLVDYRELQEQMGHEEQTTTDEYALVSPEGTSTVQIALKEVLSKIEELAPTAFHRNRTGEPVATSEEAAYI